MTQIVDLSEIRSRFLEAVGDAIPYLWRLWQHHRQDRKAFRQALADLNRDLSRGRRATDDALAAKHQAPGEDDPA